MQGAGIGLCNTAIVYFIFIMKLLVLSLLAGECMLTCDCIMCFYTYIPVICFHTHLLHNYVHKHLLLKASMCEVTILNLHACCEHTNCVMITVIVCNLYICSVTDVELDHTVTDQH